MLKGMNLLITTRDKMKRIILMFLRTFLIYQLYQLFKLCNINKYDAHTRYAFYRIAQL